MSDGPGLGHNCLFLRGFVAGLRHQIAQADVYLSTGRIIFEGGTKAFAGRYFWSVYL
jgi:hypothetical protein